MSSHSPHLASKIGLKHMILMSGGRSFPMGPAYTRLEESDYQFLERFLDVTKANLFFARGVLIVEGDAEALLLPTLAERIGRPLSKHGVSIVTVGHVGLFRYARIFQRKDGKPIPVRVACVTDRDIPPDEASPYLRGDRKVETGWTREEIAKRIESRRKNDGGPVRTFVSPCWTLEHDLAMSGLAEYVDAAVRLAAIAKTDDCMPGGEVQCQCFTESVARIHEWSQGGRSRADIAATIYQPLYEGKVSKTVTAQCLAQLLTGQNKKDLRAKLPQYLVDAIDYATGTPEVARGQEGIHEILTHATP